MPGTIQISVLEFKGRPVELSPSLLKVSLGKREYQTSDMNEFSFPLTTLRDDLIVAVYDADGNELAHLGIRTMSIVEKVYWDDIFPLEGGGYLHLKLKFMLSQQEQTRIRTMREAALKLKEKQVSGASVLSARVTNLVSPSSSHSEPTHSDPQTSSVLEVKKLEDSVQAGLFSNPGIPHGIQEPGFAEEERSIPIKEIPKDNDNREKAGSDPSGQEAKARPAKKINTQSSIHRTPQRSGSSDKASSKQELPVASSSDSLNLKSVSKVKIIANAFETGLAKDVEYTLSPAVVKVVGKKFLKGGNPKEFEPTNSVKEHDRSSRLVAVGSKLDSVRANNEISAKTNVDDVESQATVRSNQSTPLSIDPRADTKHTEEKGMSTSNSDTLSTRATSSGTEQSLLIVTDPMVHDMNTEETGRSTGYSDSDRSLTSETNSTPGKKLEYGANSENVHLYDLFAKKHYSKDGINPEEKRRKDPYATKFNPSNDESISLEFIEEDSVLFDKSEAKPCLDEMTTNIHGDSIEILQHETDEKNEKDSEESVDTKESIPESPSNDAWNGLVAQAVKIALVVGFGVLVFLTRNKQPRKTSKTKPGINLFEPSEYMNDPVIEAENWIDS